MHTARGIPKVLGNFQRCRAAASPICCDTDPWIDDDRCDLILRGVRLRDIWGYFNIFHMIGGCDYFRFRGGLVTWNFLEEVTCWVHTSMVGMKHGCPAALPRPIMAQAHDELPKCPSLDTVWRCCPVQEIQVFDPQDAPWRDLLLPSVFEKAWRYPGELWAWRIRNPWGYGFGNFPRTSQCSAYFFGWWIIWIWRYPKIGVPPVLIHFRLVFPL